MSYKSSYFRCLEHRLSTLHEDMNDEEAVNAVNNEMSKDQLRSLLQGGHTTSFLFSVKNRIGGLARVLRVFQEHDINVVHIESRLANRTNSAYEIYVDLEADRARIEQSMQVLKRQVSCVEFDPNVLLPPKENLTDENSQMKNRPLTDESNGLHMPPLSPFLDHKGHTIGRQSK